MNAHGHKEPSTHTSIQDLKSSSVKYCAWTYTTGDRLVLYFCSFAGVEHKVSQVTHPRLDQNTPFSPKQGLIFRNAQKMKHE